MNKYIYLVGLIAVIVIGGVVYQNFGGGESANSVVTGETKEFTILIKENHWSFEPGEITVNRGDKVILTVQNQDDYDHGFAIDAYGVSQRLAAKESTRIEFIATQAGDFTYYCSVPCGEGEVEGEKRGHFDQVGKLHVLDLIERTNQ